MTIEYTECMSVWVCVSCVCTHTGLRKLATNPRCVVTVDCSPPGHQTGTGLDPPWLGRQVHSRSREMDHRVSLWLSAVCNDDIV